jgi:CRISPR-associated exonuclease Cas4
MQLVVYCALIEENYGVRPAYGVIRYPERSFEVAFTLQRERELMEIVKDIEAKRQLLDVHRSHSKGKRCAACGYSEQCSERLDIQIKLPFDL